MRAKGVRGATQYTEPGTTWAYLSYHLQFAGGHGRRSIQKTDPDPLPRIFVRALQHDQHRMVPHEEPSMAGGIVTTGNDFENLLQRLLTYKVLSKEVLDQMERDYSRPGRTVGRRLVRALRHGPLVGSALDMARRAGAPSCLQSAWMPTSRLGPGNSDTTRCSTGAEGRAAGPRRPPYYMQVVLQEPDALSGIPEYLRIAAKPYVDVIMAGGTAGANRTSLLQQGGGLISRDFSYIQSELGNCACNGPGSKGKKGEPFASLAAVLPRDHPSMNRREYAAQGVGLTLLQIAQMQRSSFGTCTCTGRKKK